jgi:endonuclease/exonuclease/phosphatase family metal-dependent hydrolase
MKKMVLTIGILISTLLLFFIGFLAWQTLTEFKPEVEEKIFENANSVAIPDTFTIVSWNIGYCGLGEEMDFFYEGGKMVRPEKSQYYNYREDVLRQIKSFDTTTFILLQEVDSIARRSYHDNQLAHLRGNLPHDLFFSVNYDAWVPVPVSEPMGKVIAGVATLTSVTPISVSKVYFETSYKWPKSLFMLKRCFLETRFKTREGKELVIINTHNSAFEDASQLREKELAKLKKLMIQEYEKGNYVIVGGDWNQNPPGYDTTHVMEIYRPEVITPSIPSDFLPNDWIYAYDNHHTTNREVKTPYMQGVTGSSAIDFFILSPNINLQFVRVIPTGYKESDHQPVIARVWL